MEIGGLIRRFGASQEIEIGGLLGDYIWSPREIGGPSRDWGPLRRLGASQKIGGLSGLGASKDYGPLRRLEASQAFGGLSRYYGPLGRLGASGDYEHFEVFVNINMASNFYHSMVPQPTFVPPAQNSVMPEVSKEKKKRTRNPENWKKEKRKRAILSGQPYVNTKGELVGPRAIGPDCNCKNKCFIAVNTDNRNAIFNGYYSLNRNVSETIEHFLLQCPRFHSHRVVLRSQLLTLNVATCDLPTLLAAAGVHPSWQHAVIRLTCAFLRKTDVFLVLCSKGPPPPLTHTNRERSAGLLLVLAFQGLNSSAYILCIFSASYDEQNAYLYGLIRRHDIQRKRKPVSERRTCSYKYYVRIKGKEIQVCKKAFANIHGISDKKIRTLCIKHEQNILFPRDNRGRHRNRPKKVTPELVTLIKHHILKMLSGPNGSDYIKTEKNQGPDVNISKLHKNFLQQYEPEAVDVETDKVIKDYDAKVKSWLYFKVFHEEFKSMDFNTVKRKLSDLRKSLEASGAIPPTKKKTPKPRSRQRAQEAQNNRNVPNNLTEAPVQTLGMAMSTAPATQMTGYMGGQQPHALPPNLQLSVLGLPHTGAPFNPGTGQQPQQQPLNLQTGGNGGGQGGEQPQALPLNLHSMGGHMPSYYLSLGHMSNLISLPVSSGGGMQSASTQTANFTAQHNMQQFIPAHTVGAQTEGGPGGQPHVLQGGVGVPYTGPQHNPNMY
ncbi:hypothetical protein GWK47_026015 [Chionoecetes opilio]|uniref:Uncharacterized protein n=1 Tax=Chionoecetes opilio TaxID=41210 RepID=A0A8J8WMZ6_CHIOP|nr:hypothetical protein GWK47_026015 [Chionoecetes opilio]